MERGQDRQTAYKVKISDINNGVFTKEEGWEPNHVEINGNKVSRVNIMCVIVSKEFNENYQNIIVDDGSGRISARSFDDKINLDTFEIGEVVLLIARLREFSGEKYLTPEIVRKIKNKNWVELRKIELSKNQPKEEVKQAEEKVEDVVVESSTEKALNTIRKLDQGEGANREDVINELKDQELISELLNHGEIFEPKPGKLKVLE
ncbi:hypothetical protein ACFLZ7_03265 [Nanoarchaeota archaeon]